MPFEQAHEHRFEFGFGRGLPVDGAEDGADGTQASASAVREVEIHRFEPAQRGAAREEQVLDPSLQLVAIDARPVCGTRPRTRGSTRRTESRSTRRTNVDRRTAPLLRRRRRPRKRAAIRHFEPGGAPVVVRPRLPRGTLARARRGAPPRSGRCVDDPSRPVGSMRAGSAPKRRPCPVTFNGRGLTRSSGERVSPRLNAAP